MHNFIAFQKNGIITGCSIGKLNNERRLRFYLIFKLLRSVSHKSAIYLKG